MTPTIEERIARLEIDVANIKALRRISYSEIKASNRKQWLQRFDEYQTYGLTLTVQQLAEMCGCDTKTIRRLGVVKSCTASEFRGLLC